MHLLDLIERDVTLRRVGNNRKYDSVEYAGPCPFCGGTDRFHVWPEYQGGRYHCMRPGSDHCGRAGDAIQYLRDHDGYSYRQACAYLGMVPGEPSQAEPVMPRMPSLEQDPPGDTWQKKALQICRDAFSVLWSDQGVDMRTYLHQRGLKDGSIRQARLGYQPPGHSSIPAGLVIPGVVSGVFWQVNIRTGGDPTYKALRDSIRPLYQADLLTKDRPAMLVESELDALLLLQEAGDLVTPLATCGTQGARHLYWQLMLATPRQVLISTDADGAGDRAADWWLAHLPTARRWRPVIKDPTEMHRLGMGLREWVEDALEALRPPPAPKLQVIAGNPAAVRKIALDPDAQPRLKIVKTAQPTRYELSTRAQVLLKCVPEEMREWNVCFEAAQHYAAVNEPAYIIDFWGRGKQTHQYKPLWILLGQALATRGAPAHAAIDLLNRMRSHA